MTGQVSVLLFDPFVSVIGIFSPGALDFFSLSVLATGCNLCLW